MVEGRPLTQEDFEKVIKEIAEKGGSHPCQNGHLVSPRFFTHNESQLCSTCGEWLEARSG